jgi:hypothetical protein
MILPRLQHRWAKERAAAGDRVEKQAIEVVSTVIQELAGVAVS